MENMTLKNCNACKESIDKQASKCKHCGSSQNFFSKLNSFSLILSLVATFLSLIAISAPVITNIFLDKKPELKGVMLEGSADTIKFSLFNVGKAPTSIKGVHLSYYLDDGSHMTHMLEGKDIDKIVEPGKVYYFIAKTQDGSHLPLQTNPGGKSAYDELLPGVCTLKVIHHDFDDEELDIRIDYKCLAAPVPNNPL